MKEMLVFLVIPFVFLDLTFAQEPVVKFSRAEDLKPIGELLMIRCYLEPEPDAQANAQYYWFDNNGDPITGTNSQQNDKYVRELKQSSGLQLRFNIKEGDSGSYKCEVVVGAETYVGYYKLVTYAPITATDCQAEQHGIQGKEGKITCIASAEGTSTVISFERDGEPLSIGDGYYRFDGVGTMFITNVSQADKGEYYVVVTPTQDEDTHISTFTQQIFFDVYEPPEMLKPIMETAGNAGGEMKLFCSATGYPDIKFYWYKDLGNPLANTERIKIEQHGDQSSLVFNPLHREDRGVYTCSAENLAGTAQSQITVKVHTPPVISPMPNVTKIENDGASLVCEAYGDPAPALAWIKALTGAQISESDASKGYMVSSGKIGDDNNPGTRVTLQFSKLTRGDAGNYKCDATNNAGSSSKMVYMEILFRPNFDDQPSGPYFTWKDNSDGYLPCVVNANPAPVFEWRKGPSRRITDADPFFSIVNTRDEEKYQSTSKLMVSFNGNNGNEVFGDFTCIARNTISGGEKNVSLKMQEARIPAAPTVNQKKRTANVITVECIPNPVLGPPVTHFVAEVTVQGDGGDPRIYTANIQDHHFTDDQAVPRTLIIIDGLVAKTTYSVTIYAVSAAGNGLAVENPWTTKPLSKPESVTILNQANSEYPTSILVRWNPPDDGGAPIIHFTIEYRMVQVRNVTNAQGGYEFKAPISGQTTQRINEIPPENFRQMITGLMPGHHYEVKVTATNNEGTSEALKGVIIKTKEGQTFGLSTGAIIGIIIGVFIVLFIIVDVTCYFKNHCGILMSIRERIAGARDEGYSAAKTDDVENLAKKDHLEEAKSAEEGEMAAEQEDVDEEKKAPLLSEEQTVETVDEGEKKGVEMEPEDKDPEKKSETLENKENEAVQEEVTSEEKIDNTNTNTDEESKG